MQTVKSRRRAFDVSGFISSLKYHHSLSFDDHCKACRSEDKANNASTKDVFKGPTAGGMKEVVMV
jgi:hypothetical protein